MLDVFIEGWDLKMVGSSKTKKYFVQNEVYTRSTTDITKLQWGA